MGKKYHTGRKRLYSLLQLIFAVGLIGTVGFSMCAAVSGDPRYPAVIYSITQTLERTLFSVFDEAEAFLRSVAPSSFSLTHF